VNVIRTALAVSLFAATASAMAVEATQWNPPAGRMTRAEVQAELGRAQAAGELVARGEAFGGFDYAHQPQSTVARAQVKEELARARAEGEYPVAGETYGGFPAPHAPARSVFARKPSAQPLQHQQDAKAPAQQSGL